MGFLFNTKTTKAPKQVYDFDYRIIEKRNVNGGTYYVGEGVVNGILCVLTECRYVKERYDRERYMPRNPYDESPRPKYVPEYKLDSVKNRTLGAAYITPNPLAQFKDPCAMKREICKIIQREKNKERNLKHEVVISKGRCKGECNA